MKKEIDKEHIIEILKKYAKENSPVKMITAAEILALGLKDEYEKNYFATAAILMNEGQMIPTFFAYQAEYVLGGGRFEK